MHLSSSIIIKSWSPQSEIMFQSNANIRFYALFCLSFLEATWDDSWAALVSRLWFNTAIVTPWATLHRWWFLDNIIFCVCIDCNQSMARGRGPSFLSPVVSRIIKTEHTLVYILWYCSHGDGEKLIGCMGWMIDDFQFKRMKKSFNSSDIRMICQSA